MPHQTWNRINYTKTQHDLYVVTVRLIIKINLSAETNINMDFRGFSRKCKNSVNLKSPTHFNICVCVVLSV